MPSLASYLAHLREIILLSVALGGAIALYGALMFAWWRAERMVRR